MPKISASPCPARLAAATGSGPVAPYLGAASGGTRRRRRICGAWRHVVAAQCAAAAVAAPCVSLVRRRCRLRISRLGEDCERQRKTAATRLQFDEILRPSQRCLPTLYYIGPNHNKPRVSLLYITLAQIITKPKISSKHCCEVLLLTIGVFGLGCLILCIKFLISEYQTRLYGTPVGLF